MSGIVLSASVRQNLLSLQSTASLLATTQNTLATGNKVNSALDNPTEFFTSQGLNNRASDIGNLLDSIGNGVQVIQAANTGITSLQTLVESAKSIANQVLQQPSGFSTLSSVTSLAVSGATANNLLGTGTNATVKSTTAIAAGGIVDTGANISFQINGKTVTLTTGTGSGSVTAGLKGFTTTQIESQINNTAGIGVVATDDGAGKITLTSTGGKTSLDAITTSGTTAAGLGIADGTVNGTDGSLSGQTLSIAATTEGGVTIGTATNITFGFGAGEVSTLNDLNTQLAKNDLQAAVDPTSGTIAITTSSNAAAATIGTVTGTKGTSTATTAAFSGLTASAPVEDPVGQANRAGLVTQFNNILSQIDTTSQDSSFNGINLLNGDTLNLTFDETGASKLNISTNGAINSAGLGLSQLTAGTDFLDSNSANAVLKTLGNASTQLTAAASELGSNLSIVQSREDFNKSLINVLQTGASNLTLADTNQEAADSQALSTRQSIGVSALSLANQSQQSVLQLLR
jgi:flagellin